MKSRSLGRLSALGLGLSSLLIAGSVRAGMTAGEAQAKADHYEKLADHYWGLGGMALKGGLIEQAQRQEAKYQAMADKASASTQVSAANQPTETVPMWSTSPWWKPTSASTTSAGNKATAAPTDCRYSKPAIQALDCPD